MTYIFINSVITVVDLLVVYFFLPKIYRRTAFCVSFIPIFNIVAWFTFYYDTKDFYRETDKISGA